MIYHSNDSINKNKIAIGKKIDDNAALLSYVAAPEITADDFNINIMHRSSSYENIYIPVKNGNDYSQQYKININGILDTQDILLTNKFYGDKPLYYKETIDKKENMYIQVLLNDSVVNTDYLLEETNNEYIIYHSFSEKDNPQIICSVNGNASIRYPSYSKIFTESTDAENVGVYTYSINKDLNEIILSFPEEVDYNKVVVSESRSGLPISFKIEAEATLDFDANKEYRLGIVSDNKAKVEALSKYFKEDRCKFVDPRNNGFYISSEEFATCYHQYDLIMVIGSGDIILDRSAWENAIKEKLVFIDNHDQLQILHNDGEEDYLKLAEDRGFLETESVVENHDTDASTIKTIADELKKNYGYKTYSDTITIEQGENSGRDNVKIEVGENRLIISSYVFPLYNSDKEVTSFSIQQTYENGNKEGYIEINKTYEELDGVTLFVKYIYIDLTDYYGQGEFIKTKDDDGVIVSLSNITNSSASNIANCIDYLYKVLENKLNRKIITTPWIKEFIVPHNQLYPKEYDFAGYEKIILNNKEYSKKIIHRNLLNYVQGFSELSIKSIDSAKIILDKEYSNLKQTNDGELNGNSAIEFYLTSGISSLNYQDNRYCSMDNAKKSYEVIITCDISKNNTLNRKVINKKIDISYIPRKHIVSLSDMIRNQVDSSFDHLNIISVICRESSNLNIFVKNKQTNKYYFSEEQSFATITREEMSDIVLEISEVLYDMHTSKERVAISSPDAFADCLSIDKHVKEYQLWSPLIKNMSFDIERDGLKYRYETPDFYNQYFIRDNIRSVKHELATIEDFRIIGTQKTNICENQTIDYEETLVRITDNAWQASYPINKINEIKIEYSGSDGSEIKEIPEYIIHHNLVIFKQSQLDARYQIKIRYKYNYFNIYQASKNPSTIKYYPLTTFNNVETVMCLANKTDTQFTDAANIAVYEKKGKEYILVNANKYEVEEYAGLIVFKEFERKQYYVSGQIINNKPLNVINTDYKNGLVYVEETLEFSDDIYIDYLYHENKYQYLGYENNFIDLNPVEGHICIVNGEKKPSRDYVNKPCYIVLFPHKIYSGNTLVSTEAYPVKHTFNRAEALKWRDTYYAIILGTFSLTNNYDLSDISIIDCRSMGRGLKESVDYNDFYEAQFFYDIEDQSKYSYNPNGFGIIKLPMQLLKSNGGVYDEDYVKKIVEKYKPVGCKYEIVYYDIFKTDILPKEELNNRMILKSDLIKKYFTYEAAN